jgi:hypothetical protein
MTNNKLRCLPAYAVFLLFGEVLRACLLLGLIIVAGLSSLVFVRFPNLLSAGMSVTLHTNMGDLKLELYNQGKLLEPIPAFLLTFLERGSQGLRKLSCSVCQWILQ